MSWDFGLVAPDITDANGYQVRLAGYEDLNYTYNVAPMYVEAMGEKGIRRIDGMLCKDALPILDEAIKRMDAEPEKYRAMNPPNGWGDFEGAVQVLRRLRQWCEDVPEAEIAVW